MNYNFNNKKVVIIGGSSGIGKAVALLAGKLGATLIIGARDRDKLNAFSQELNELAIANETYTLDAHDDASLEKFFASIPDFDHLVSMIGDVSSGSFLSDDFSTIQHVIESKFFTNLKIARLASEKINKGGSIVFTSGAGGSPSNSSASFVGNADIRLLTQGLAKELAPKIRVNTVAPFWMATPFWRQLPKEDVLETVEKMKKIIPLGRTGTIEEVAAAYLFFLQNTFVTGQQLFVDGGVGI